MLAGIVRAKLLRNPSPLAVGFEITHRCNLRCAYCDRNTRQKREMSLAEILAALGGLHRLGMRAVSLDGGEPLVHEHVDTVIDWLAERGVLLRINTNGVLIERHREAIRHMAKVKISLDGPEAVHDAARGRGSFYRAVRGAMAARDLGCTVELTCVVGPHNVDDLEELLDIAHELAMPVVFQPLRESLVRCAPPVTRDSDERVRHAFRRLEDLKRADAPVGNRWSSLKHFCGWPRDTPLPCAAGWINATLDPCGNLFACAQTDRTGVENSVIALGAREAFRRVSRAGCRQCWCARVVEENYAWGGRADMFVPRLVAGPRAAAGGSR
jgi:MoaA/NifB/PqqE/SkfB family radical SAM enzyme